MSARGIEARLIRIERAMDVDDPDEFSFLERLSDDDLQRFICARASRRTRAAASRMRGLTTRSVFVFKNGRERSRYDARSNSVAPVREALFNVGVRTGVGLWPKSSVRTPVRFTGL